MLDVTVGTNTSESYVTVSEADEYFSNLFFKTFWESISGTFTSFTPAISTVYSTTSHTCIVGDTIYITGTYNDTLDSSQLATAVTASSVTTSLDSTGLTTSSGRIASLRDKERLLKVSALSLEHFVYRGTRYNSDQRLAFPRYDGYLGYFELDDTKTLCGTIPEAVKKAQLEILMYLYLNKSATNGTIDNKDIKNVSVVEGLAEVEYRFKQGSSDDIKFSVSIQSVKSFLRPFIYSSNAVPIR